MARELNALDISDNPALLRLADEVRASGEPRLLRRAGEDLAILMPVRRAQPAEPMRSVDAWDEADTGERSLEIYESRLHTTRSPEDL
jgi:hypothetical protein